MKKIFTLLLSIGSFTAVFAQGGRYNNRDNNVYNPRNNDVVMNNDHGRNYGNNNANVYNYPQPSNRDHDRNDRARQEELDRMNRDYDRRVNDYRNDRSLPSYERDRRIADVERERREKSASFGKGAVVGAVAGVLLGVLIAHH